MKPLKPIRTKADHNAALKEIESLMRAKPRTPEGDRLDVLVALVEAYEFRHYPIEAPDPVELLKFVMEQRGMTRGDLAPYIGSSGRVSEVLNRVRPLTLEMIRRLSEGLGLPASALIQKYRLAG